MALLNRRVPLAWLNLTHSKARFFLSVAGISFAVVLMLVQLGFWRALLDSQTAIIRAANADIVLVPTAMSTITDMQSFPLVRLRQAEAVPGVRSALPLYIRYFPFTWKNPEGNDHLSPQWPIRVLAFRASEPVPTFREEWLPTAIAMRERLLEPGVALIDLKSKPQYDVIAAWRQTGESPVNKVGEVADQRLRIIGTFELGTDFSTDGTMIMSTRNLTHYVGPGTEDEVQIGLITVEEGADVDKVIAELRLALPPEDVHVMTRDDLVAQEETFWQSSTPIGFIFLLGLIVGFVVGVVICYQILSTEVADHLAEFATLKAIGYHDRYVSGVVLQEALWLSLLGFVAGLALGWPLYIALENATGLPLRITVPRAGLILGLTVGMCILSGLMALQRVRTADPAEVFA